MKANEAIRKLNTPISKAVEPQRKAAVSKARDDAQSIVDKVHADLAKHDWNLHAAAPRPHWREQSSYSGQNALRKHDLYKSLTTLNDEKNDALHYADRNNQHHVLPRKTMKVFSVAKGNHTVEHDPGKKFVDDAEENAHVGYDSFVAKLHDKVGDHTHAELTGNHVWGHSILHITHKDGSTQKWKTQQIFKLSKLGKPHNQWPTRKVK